MIRIGDWQVDPQTCTLSRQNETRKISPRAMDVLVHLSKNAGAVVSAEDLLQNYWPSRAASDHAVHKVLAALRQALGDSTNSPKYIKTYPKRGYAIIAEVEVDQAKQPTPASANTASVIQALQAQAIRHWQSLSAGVMAVAGLALIMAFGTLPTTSNTSDTAVIGINPVSYIGSDSASPNAYLASGLKSALTSNLAGIPNLTVRNLAFLESVDFDSPVNTANLPLDHMLDSSLTEVDGKLIVDIELTEVATAETLYSDRFESTEGDILGIQDWIVDQVTSSLRIMLDEEQRTVMHDWGTRNAQAYDHFIKAEFYKQQWNHKDWEQALLHYQEAIDIDPHFVNAYTGLATAANYMMVYSRRDQVDELTQMLTDYARELELLDIDDAAVETLKSMVLNTEGTRQILLAERYKQQILNGDAEKYVFAQYGLFLMGARLYDEAEQFISLAASDDPYRTAPNQHANFITGSITPWDAIPVKKQQIIDQPKHIGMLGTLILNLGLVGNIDEAEYYLKKQKKVDSAGVRSHLSMIRISAFTGELFLQEQLYSGKFNSDLQFNFSYPELFSTDVLTAPDLQYNNGVMRLILGDVTGAREHWLRLTPVDHRKLITRLHATEILFPDEVLESAEYHSLLEELGVGRSWQKQLMDGVLAMEKVTGITLNHKSMAANENDRLLAKNNLWADTDWLKLDTLKPKPAKTEISDLLGDKTDTIELRLPESF